MTAVEQLENWFYKNSQLMGIGNDMWIIKEKDYHHKCSIGELM